MPRFVLSLAIFLALALLFGQFSGLVANKYEYPLHSWSWWSVRELKKLRLANHSSGQTGESNGFAETDAVDAPNTVLLGSSLMVVANAECDATWRNERLDLTTYRKARYFDAVVSSATGEDTVSLNLSAPGQIPSDAYLTLKEALSEGLRPGRVVYGVAPRDFIDSTMGSAYDTEGYKYLSRIVPCEEIDQHLNNGLLETGSHLIGRSLPLCRHAVDLQMSCFDFVSRQTQALLPTQVLSLEKRMALLSTYEPLDMVPGFIHAEVARPEECRRLYSDNLNDYQARYRHPKPEFYKGQLLCLAELARLCRENTIELLVVNMPVRECNIALLDKNLLRKFRADVERISTANGACYVDLCQFADYDKLDYRDSVHLNGFGGRKFLNRLAKAIPLRQRRPAPAVAVRENRGSRI
jgi:hypothetical protein